MQRRFAHATDSLEPRFEMTPLLDVIFLLITFFLYSMVMMVQAKVLPVEQPVLASARPAEDKHIVAITIDRDNKLYINRKPVAVDQIAERVASFVEGDKRPAIYIAPDGQLGPADRLPMFLSVIDRLRDAGFNDFSIVGVDPKHAPAPTSAGGTAK